MELPKIHKASSVLLDDCFKNPKTILLNFHFEPHLFPSIAARLKTCTIQSGAVEDKSYYIIDNFFSATEAKTLQDFSQTAPFSLKIFASDESKAQGERPARAMNSQERWQFFSHPPEAVCSLFRLFNLFASQMDAEISTLPWDLCSENSSSPCFATNFLEEMSTESMEFGKHRDYHPANKIAFGIPLLYGKKEELHPPSFLNGAPGKPHILTFILYSAANTFQSEYGLGTVLYQDSGKEAVRVACEDTRLLIFEGDLIHSIEESKLPPDIETWRVSYVFKLVFNPMKENLSMKQQFSNMLQT